MEDMVISGSDITFGLLEDLFKQLKVGAKDPSKGINGKTFRALLEHRNILDRAEVEKVLSYADEEVESNYGYPLDFYFRSIADQLKVWGKHFSDFDNSYVPSLVCRPLPSGAEHWGIIPKPSKLGSNYHEALDKMLGLVAKQSKFQNWQGGELGPDYLQLVEKTAQIIAQMEKETPGDFLVLPYQFGMRWRGKSVRRAQVLFDDNEFGLGPYEIAALLLAHPNRISGLEQLYIDCAGCEYRLGASGRFGFCLCFFWGSGHERLGLVCGGVDDADSNFGAGSAFRL